MSMSNQTAQLNQQRQPKHHQQQQLSSSSSSCSCSFCVSCLCWFDCTTNRQYVRQLLLSSIDLSAVQPHMSNQLTNTNKTNSKSVISQSTEQHRSCQSCADPECERFSCLQTNPESSNLHFHRQSYRPHRCQSASSHFRMESNAAEFANDKSNYNFISVSVFLNQTPLNNKSNSNQFMHKIGSLNSVVDSNRNQYHHDHHDHHCPSGINYLKLDKQDYNQQQQQCNCSTLVIWLAQSEKHKCWLHQDQVKLKTNSLISNNNNNNYTESSSSKLMCQMRKNNAYLTSVTTFNLDHYSSLWNSSGHVMCLNNLPPQLISSSSIRSSMQSSSLSIHTKQCKQIIISSSTVSSIMDGLNQLSQSLNCVDSSQSNGSSSSEHHNDNQHYTDSTSIENSLKAVFSPPPPSPHGLNLPERTIFLLLFSSYYFYFSSSCCFLSRPPISSIRSSSSSSLESWPFSSSTSTTTYFASFQVVFSLLLFLVGLLILLLPLQRKQIWKTNFSSSSSKVDIARPNGPNDGEFIRCTVKENAVENVVDGDRRWRRCSQDEHYDKSSLVPDCAAASYLTDADSFACSHFFLPGPSKLDGSVQCRKYVDSQIDNDTAHWHSTTTTAHTELLVHSSDNGDEPERNRKNKRTYPVSSHHNLGSNLNNEVDEKIEHNSAKMVPMRSRSSSTETVHQHRQLWQLFNLSSRSFSSLCLVPIFTATLAAFFVSACRPSPFKPTTRISSAFGSVCLAVCLLLSSASFQPPMAMAQQNPSGESTTELSSTTTTMSPMLPTPLASRWTRTTSSTVHLLGIMNDPNHRSEANVDQRQQQPAGFTTVDTIDSNHFNNPSPSSHLLHQQQSHSIDNELLSADLFDDIGRLMLLQTPNDAQPIDGDRSTSSHWTCIPSHSISNADALDTVTRLLTHSTRAQVNKWMKKETIHLCLMHHHLTFNYSQSVSSANGKTTTTSKKVETKSQLAESNNNNRAANNRRTITKVFGPIERVQQQQHRQHHQQSHQKHQGQQQTASNKKWLKKLNLAPTITCDKRLCQAARDGAARGQWCEAVNSLLEQLSALLTQSKLLSTGKKQFDIKMDLDLRQKQTSEPSKENDSQSSKASPDELITTRTNNVATSGKRDNSATSITGTKFEKGNRNCSNRPTTTERRDRSTVITNEHSINASGGTGMGNLFKMETSIRLPSQNGTNSQIEVTNWSGGDGGGVGAGGGGTETHSPNGTSEAVNVEPIKKNDDDDDNRGTGTNSRRGECNDYDYGCDCEHTQRDGSSEPGHRTKGTPLADHLLLAQHSIDLLAEKLRQQNIRDKTTSQATVEQLKNTQIVLFMMIYVNDEPESKEEVDQQQQQKHTQGDNWNRYSQTNDAASASEYIDLIVKQRLNAEAEEDRARIKNEVKQQKQDLWRRLSRVAMSPVNEYSNSSSTPSCSSTVCCRVIESEKLRFELNRIKNDFTTVNNNRNTRSEHKRQRPLIVLVCTAEEDAVEAADVELTEGEHPLNSTTTDKNEVQQQQTNVDIDLLLVQVKLLKESIQQNNGDAMSPSKEADQPRQDKQILQRGNNSSIRTPTTAQQHGTMVHQANWPTQSVTASLRNTSSLSEHDIGLTQQQSEQASNNPVQTNTAENLPVLEAPVTDAALHPVGRRAVTELFEYDKKLQRPRRQHENGSLGSSAGKSHLIDLFTLINSTCVEQARRREKKHEIAFKANSTTTTAARHKWPLTIESTNMEKDNNLSIERNGQVENGDAENGGELVYNSSNTNSLNSSSGSDKSMDGATNGANVKRSVKGNKPRRTQSVEDVDILISDRSTRARTKRNAILPTAVDASVAASVAAAANIAQQQQLPNVNNKNVTNEHKEAFAKNQDEGKQNRRIDNKITRIEHEKNIRMASANIQPNTSLINMFANDTSGPSEQRALWMQSILDKQEMNIELRQRRAHDRASIHQEMDQIKLKGNNNEIVKPIQRNNTTANGIVLWGQERAEKKSEKSDRSNSSALTVGSGTDQMLLKSHSTNLVASANRLPQDILKTRLSPMHSPLSGPNNVDCDSVPSPSSSSTSPSTSNNLSFICANLNKASETSTTLVASLRQAPVEQLSQSSSSPSVNNRNNKAQHSHNRADHHRVNLSLNNSTQPSAAVASPLNDDQHRNTATNTATTTTSQSNATRNDDTGTVLLHRSRQTNLSKKVELLNSGSSATIAAIDQFHPAVPESKLSSSSATHPSTTVTSSISEHQQPNHRIITSTKMSPPRTAHDIGIINDDLNANNGATADGDDAAAAAADSDRASAASGRIKLHSDYNRLNQHTTDNGAFINGNAASSSANNKATSAIQSHTTTTLHNDNLTLSKIGVNSDDDNNNMMMIGDRDSNKNHSHDRERNTTESDNRRRSSGTTELKHVATVERMWNHAENDITSEDDGDLAGRNNGETRLESNLTEKRVELHKNGPHQASHWPSYGDEHQTESSDAASRDGFNDIQLDDGNDANISSQQTNNNIPQTHNPTSTITGSSRLSSSFTDSVRSITNAPDNAAVEQLTESDKKRFKVSTTSSSTWQTDTTGGGGGDGAAAVASGNNNVIISTPDTEVMSDGLGNRTTPEISASTITLASVFSSSFWPPLGDKIVQVANFSTLQSKQARIEPIDPVLAYPGKPHRTTTTTSTTSSNIRYCPPGIDPANNITWARSDAGVLALQPCPAHLYYSGTVYRPCKSSGVWTVADLTDCRLKPLKELHRLVFQHVQKHLLDGLVPLTIQLKQLLVPVPRNVSTSSSTSSAASPLASPLHSPLDRIDALAVLNAILLNSKIKIRIDTDQDEERRTIQFVQSLMMLSEHLLIKSKSINFPPDDEVQNALLIGQLVETLNGFRVLMENLLRALILSCQDGSIKSLLRQEQPLLPSTLDNIEINLSHRMPSGKKLLPLIETKISTISNATGWDDGFGSTCVKCYCKPKLTIKVQDFTKLGVGVVQLWLHDLGNSLDYADNQVVSDLLLVSIVPAVSIEVDFEVAPKFEVAFPLWCGKYHHNNRHDQLNRLVSLDGDGEEEDNNNQLSKRVIQKNHINELDNNYSDNLEEEVQDGGNNAETEEDSELSHEYGWSSNNNNNKKTTKIACARLLTTAHQTSIWTLKGCSTESQNNTHLKCICMEQGIIAAITVPELPEEAFGGGQSLEEIDPSLSKVDTKPIVHVNLDNAASNQNNLATNNLVAHRHFVYGSHFGQKRRLSSYDITLYISLITSVVLLIAILIIQYRLRQYETIETFFIVRNLVIGLLLIQLTFLFGTTFHMDLFWIRVAQLSPSLETPAFYRMKHILCLAVPIFLHFIHLASLFWMLSHTIMLYQRFWRPVVILTDDCNETNIEDIVTNKQAKIAQKTKKSKYLPNSNQLSSTSKENRKRYLKQTKSKYRNNKGTKLNQYRLIRLLGTVSSILIYPLRKFSIFVKSKSILRMLTKSSSNNNNNLQCGMQMESIVPIGESSSVIFGEADSSTTTMHCNTPQIEYHGKVDHTSLVRENATNNNNNEPCTAEQEETINNNHNSACKLNITSSSSKQSNATGILHRLFTFPCCCLSLSGSTWKCQHYLALSMGLPFILVLLSYLLNPKGYETRRYCWMSIEGGIQYSFIIPVLVLITMNTLLMLFVLKRYFERKPLTHRVHLHQIRPSLRASIILLPFFSLNWFLSVLSLETLTTSPFELIFALTNCLHSFLVFYYHCYQRYNIQYFLKIRSSRLHLKRRVTKLFYRLISAVNVWFWPNRGSAISRSSSFNWSDFQSSSTSLEHQSKSGECSSAQTCETKLEEHSNVSDYSKHNHSHHHYHEPAPIGYKSALPLKETCQVSPSGSYCNHHQCFCNHCSNGYNPKDLHQNYAEPSTSSSNGNHPSFYCNCVSNEQESIAKALDCYQSHEQSMYMNYGGYHHSCTDHHFTGALPTGLRTSFNLSHGFESDKAVDYLSDKSVRTMFSDHSANSMMHNHLSIDKINGQFVGTFPGEEDEEVVIVELDEDEDDIDDGSEEEEEESDEVMEDEDEYIDDMESSINDYLRKNY